MITHILIEIEGIGAAYQEVSEGQVLRYLDLNGVELFKTVPIGQGSWVTDADPPKQGWM